ncbi:unnamed protein product [Darwinula stevensoni]|uniref:Uncharacterized protein n=1 Tax=Darwinula stevensoni TaxID=69355 RepID=A0A7R8XCX1_9CRUS|nr:unnamed protein product [Darwinula stevensoni]CAG0892676.1 unnamed protein product [Darwinula stevensoni]
MPTNVEALAAIFMSWRWGGMRRSRANERCIVVRASMETMLFSASTSFILLLSQVAHGVWIPQEYSASTWTADFGKFLAQLIQAEGSHGVIVLFDYQSYSEGDRRILLDALQEKPITVLVYGLRDEDSMQSFLSTMEAAKDQTFKHYGVLVVTRDQQLGTSLLDTIRTKDLIRRGFLYIFTEPLEEEMRSYRIVIEPMRIVFLRRRDPRTLSPSGAKSLHVSVYYNQACPSPCPRPVKVNDWSIHRGFSSLPPLPRPEDVYRNFQGRTFHLPVIQNVCPDKVPLSHFHHSTPAMAQSFLIRTFLLQLGPIRKGEDKRDYEWFLDDTSMTDGRSIAVEFSFPTLQGLNGYISRAPPPEDPLFFEVTGIALPGWTLLLFAGLLITVAHAGLQWAAGEGKDVLWRAFFAAFGGFLQQGIPGRVFMAFFLSYTLIMGTLIRASLVSFYTNPGKVKPMETLIELDEAMGRGDAKAIVVRDSSSSGIFEIGTEVYASIFHKMQRQKGGYTVESIEDCIQGVLSPSDGIPTVCSEGRIALNYFAAQINAGKEREVLHVNAEEFFVKYKAIAMQWGAAYLDAFDKILARMWEAGIMYKLTDDEFKRQELQLGIQHTESGEAHEKRRTFTLQRMSSAFFLLFAGIFIAGIDESVLERPILETQLHFQRSGGGREVHCGAGMETMLFSASFILLLSLPQVSHGIWIPPIEEHPAPTLTADFGKFLAQFFLAEGFRCAIVLFDYQSYSDRDRQTLLGALQEKPITILLFNLRDEDSMQSFLLTMEASKRETFRHYGILVVTRDQQLGISLLKTIRAEDLIRRGFLYVFTEPLEEEMRRYRITIEPMRIVFLQWAFLTHSPRTPNRFPSNLHVSVYYNQACPSPCPRPVKVNDWSIHRGFSSLPPLPRPEDVFRDFQGRTFRLPLLRAFFIHLQRWLRVFSFGHFFYSWVLFENERIKGSEFVNGTFPGVLGRIMNRDYEWFLDDTTVTYERNIAVEFSFPTLQGLNGYISRAPPPEDPAFFEVTGIASPGWTLLLFSVLLVAVAHAGLQWAAGERKDVLWRAFFAAFGGFLQQDSVPVPHGNPGRVLMACFFSYTLIMGTLIRASLVSFYSDPGKVQPMETLAELDEAMGGGDVKAIVVEESSTSEFFVTGTGVYASIFHKMLLQKGGYTVENIEDCIQGVLSPSDGIPTVCSEGRIALNYFAAQVNAGKGEGERQMLLDTLQEKPISTLVFGLRDDDSMQSFLAMMEASKRVTFGYYGILIVSRDQQLGTSLLKTVVAFPLHVSVYYNQACPSPCPRPVKVNDWSIHLGFSSLPPLPRPESAYRDLQGRTFRLPVIQDYEWFLDDTTTMYERSIAVEFSFPTLQGLNGYVTRAPPPEDPPFFEIYGISTPGWTLLLFAGIVIFIAHAGLQWAAGERKDVMWRAFYAAFGGFSQQDSVPVPPGNSGRVLMVFFLSYFLIMGTLMRASLVSFYSDKGKMNAMETLDELDEALGRGDVKAIVVRGSSTYAIFATGTEVYASIFDKMQRQSSGYIVDNIEKCVQAVLTPSDGIPAVCIEGRIALDYFAEKINAGKEWEVLHVNADKFFVKYKGVAMQWGSAYLPAFDKMRGVCGGIAGVLLGSELRMLSALSQYQSLLCSVSKSQPGSRIRIWIPPIEEHPAPTLTADFGKFLVQFFLAEGFRCVIVLFDYQSYS